MKVLVTGGCGYIGSHTIVDLINNGFDVVSVDSNIRSSTQLLEGVEKITGKKVRNYKVDLCNLEDTHAVFHENRDIIGVIHFAALKTVPESVSEPLLYFHNNLTSLTNVLKCVKEFNIPNMVFSSSCSVYGNTNALPVVEETPLGEAQSPYARTKQMGEQIIEDYSRVNSTQSILLRYFNPVGAHPSALIGELP
ncbi:MAG: galE, partial [Bacteroidetes bacterium]|nr:galE [Bacteroidota bacterium]